MRRTLMLEVVGIGGHPGAGGCHLPGDLVTTKERVVRAPDAAFNKSRPVTEAPPPANVESREP